MATIMSDHGPLATADGISIRALIVDHADISRRQLRTQLASIQDIELVGEASSTSEARQMIMELQPDVVFMDAEIPGGNVIEMLRNLDLRPEVVFVTAHPEFALPAFDVQAVDYLVKPVRQERLVESVQRVRRRIAEGRVTDLALKIVRVAAAIDGRYTAVPQPAAYPSQIVVRVRRRMYWLNVDDIIWIQGASQYSRVHSKTGEFLLSRSLSALECELDPRCFFRIHRSAIVNADQVQEIRTSGDGRYNVFLRSGPILPLGRSRREVLRKLVENIGRAAAV
jgi:two-component system LytT family response regulator